MKFLGIGLTCESRMILSSSTVSTSFSRITDPNTIEDRPHLDMQFLSHELFRQLGWRSDARTTPQTFRKGEHEVDGERQSLVLEEMTLSLLVMVLVMTLWLLLLLPFKWLERGPFLITDSETMLLLDESAAELRGTFDAGLNAETDDANDLDWDEGSLLPVGG